jgi:hypothetical protein
MSVVYHAKMIFLSHNFHKLHVADLFWFWKWKDFFLEHKLALQKICRKKIIQEEGELNKRKKNCFSSLYQMLAWKNYSSLFALPSTRKNFSFLQNEKFSFCKSLMKWKCWLQYWKLTNAGKLFRYRSWKRVEINSKLSQTNFLQIVTQTLKTILIAAIAKLQEEVRCILNYVVPHIFNICQVYL